MARFGGRTPHSSMAHLNGNLLCAIDTETTGLDFRRHDIIQLAILPLDACIKPLQTVRPFVIEMIPKNMDAIEPGARKTHRIDMAQLILRAIDPWKAVDHFEDWFTKLNLPLGKKIMPLAHNWLFDRNFIESWLGGPLSFDNFFHFHFRDSMTAALFMNDRADQKMDPVPYPKVSLKYCCSQLSVRNERAHDALQDCVATAEVYRNMLYASI